MNLLSDVKNLIGRNGWISAGLLFSGIFLLKLSDTPLFINFVRRLIPSLSFNFVENTVAAIGITALLTAFGAFVVWIKAVNKKRMIKRKIAFRQIANAMNWNFSENLTDDLKSYVDALIQKRARAFPPTLNVAGQNTANFLSKEFNGDLVIVFDCIFTVRNNTDTSSTYFETIYAVISDKLNLPYFQTQPETWLGDNAFVDLIKTTAGINDLKFPERPVFSQKYIVDVSPADAARVFTPAVLDFYEQNQLQQISGDDRLLALSAQQEQPVTQSRINAHLQTLHRLFQLLKTD